MRIMNPGRRLGALAAGVIFALAFASPVAAQVLKAEVGVDGMT